MRFSAVLAVINAEKTLPDAIESLASICDDIVVVVDTRTTDRTIDIAKARGARIFERKFDGFATQKNYGIDQAKHDWVLILDDDERLTDELRSAIKEAPATGHAAHRIPRRNYLGRKWMAHGGLYPDYQVRLFNRHKARYEGREVHEELAVDGLTGSLDGDLVHLTYDNVLQYLQKVRKYSVAQAKEDRRLKKVEHLRRPWRAAIGELIYRYLKLSGWRDGWVGIESATLLAYYSLRYWRELSR